MSDERDIPPAEPTLPRPSSPAEPRSGAGFQKWDAAAPDAQRLALGAVKGRWSDAEVAAGEVSAGDIEWVEPRPYEPSSSAARPPLHPGGAGAETPAGPATVGAALTPTAPATAPPRATAHGNGPAAPPGGEPPKPDVALNSDGDRPRRPRIYRLRLAMILAGLALIALASTVFGMMMAVASDLPALENRAQYRNARNSILVDIHGKSLGVLTGKENKVLVHEGQVSPAMVHAIIAIEDRRFYEHNGVDFRGIGRALWEDLSRQRAAQGASTIPQQFVKNALAAQHHRTLFEKLREAALAYHLTRKWSKEKILTEYLNTVYFGNGAYGIESAARVYWKWRHPNCGTTLENACASQLEPGEAALLAGVVASPSAYDPVAHPQAARERRREVLRDMLSQGYISHSQYVDALLVPLPTQSQLTYPREDSKAPYFTTWVKQQVVDQFGAQQAFSGGLKVKTTLDLQLQDAAQQAVESHLPDPSGPRAALVAIDNYTGEVRAMVGGDDYAKQPFNLATQGERQPGSAFKPFVLAEALQQGVSPDSTWASKPKSFVVPRTGGKEHFNVNNYESDYSGSNTLAGATTVSDNSIFAEVAIKVGTPKIAHLAERMGIRTPVSTNYAIALGGLKQGVTPLDMAHAYETFAEDGKRVSGSLGAGPDGPVGIRAVYRGKKLLRQNQRITRRVLPATVAQTATGILQTVVTSGTGRAAALGSEPAAGKTGTTENYGDAWFVGYTKKYTVAVWVGYPNGVRPMKTEYNGGPVAGGTFPAEIWHDFVTSALQIDAQRRAALDAKRGKSSSGSGIGSGAFGAAPATTATPAPSTSTSGQTSTGPAQTGAQPPSATKPVNPTGGGGGNAAPPAPAPVPQPAPTPAPPTGGGGGGTGGGTSPSGGSAPPPG